MQWPCSELVFAPTDEMFPDDAPLMPWRFSLYLLAHKPPIYIYPVKGKLLVSLLLVICFMFTNITVLVFVWNSYSYCLPFFCWIPPINANGISVMFGAPTPGALLLLTPALVSILKMSLASYFTVLKALLIAQLHLNMGWPHLTCRPENRTPPRVAQMDISFHETERERDFILGHLRSLGRERKVSYF